jgi:hypothetical protein
VRSASTLTEMGTSSEMHCHDPPFACPMLAALIALWSSDVPLSMSSRNRWSALGAAVLLGTFAGCAAHHDHALRSAPMTAAQPKIELLGFPDCPNTPELRDNLKSALDSMGNGWTFADTNQEALPEGDLRRGWPTPTILVNERDLFGMPAPTAPSMGCRMYPGGVPDAETIARRLRSETRQP